MDNELAELRGSTQKNRLGKLSGVGSLSNFGGIRGNGGAGGG